MLPPPSPASPLSAPPVRHARQRPPPSVHLLRRERDTGGRCLTAWAPTMRSNVAYTGLVLLTAVLPRAALPHQSAPSVHPLSATHASPHQHCTCYAGSVTPGDAASQRGLQPRGQTSPTRELQDLSGMSPQFPACLSCLSPADGFISLPLPHLRFVCRVYVNFPCTLPSATRMSLLFFPRIRLVKGVLGKRGGQYQHSLCTRAGLHHRRYPHHAVVHPCTTASNCESGPLHASTTSSTSYPMLRAQWCFGGWQGSWWVGRACSPALTRCVQSHP